MAFTTRILPKEEWARVAETPILAETWQQVDPSLLDIVIVEDDAGQIVACWGTFLVRHVEGFWVRPDHQKRGGVLRALFVGMRSLLRSLGQRVVVTQAESDTVTSLLESAGAARLPGQSFLLPVDFGPWAKEG